MLLCAELGVLGSISSSSGHANSWFHFIPVHLPRLHWLRNLQWPPCSETQLLRPPGQALLHLQRPSAPQCAPQTGSTGIP